jgi:hypothetical protein
MAFIQLRSHPLGDLAAVGAAFGRAQGEVAPIRAVVVSGGKSPSIWKFRL